MAKAYDDHLVHGDILNKYKEKALKRALILKIFVEFMFRNVAWKELSCSCGACVAGASKFHHIELPSDYRSLGKSYLWHAEFKEICSDKYVTFALSSSYLQKSMLDVVIGWFTNDSLLDLLFDLVFKDLRYVNIVESKAITK